MKRWIGPIATLALTAIAAHWATLHYAPSVIMDRALSTLKDRGIAEHAFTTPRRITPQTQAVVRSSPDLFYSLCRYDLNRPDVGDRGTNPRITIEVADWEGYQSLSLFDEETNNYVTFRLSGKSGRFVLGEHSDLEGQTVDVDGKASTIINSPTKRGVILIRRLAPTKAAFAKAEAAAKEDRCEFIQPPAIVF